MINRNDELTTEASRRSGLFRKFDGPLTADLLLSPGGFGLGQLPVRQVPDGTTPVTCG